MKQISESLGRGSLPHRREAIGSLRVVEWGLSVLLLLVFIGVHPLAAVESTVELTGDGDLARQFAYLSAIAVILGAQPNLLVRGRALSVIPLSLSLALGWCVLSIAWAIEPLVAIRRLGLTIGVIFAIFAAVEAIGIERAFVVLRRVLILVLVGNYFAIAFSPVAIHPFGGVEPQLAGDWRGLLDHKNAAGPLCALTILVFIFQPGRLQPVARWLVIVAAGYFLLRTNSKSAIGLAAAALAYGLLVLSVNVRGRIAVTALVTLAILSAPLLGLVDMDDLFQSFSGPDAFTGRGQIWPILLDYAGNHLFTGAGYGSFWNVGWASPVYSGGASEWITHIATGHQGYLDLLVQVGLPGLILAVIASFVIPLWNTTFDRRMPRSLAAVLGAGVFFSMAHNFTESSLFTRDAVVWVLTVFFLALVTQFRGKAAPEQEGNLPVVVKRRRRVRGQAIGTAS